MSWRDCAFCDLDLARMKDGGEMQKWRGTRGHARCPLRPVVVGDGGLLRMVGVEGKGWRGKDRRRKVVEN